MAAALLAACGDGEPVQRGEVDAGSDAGQATEDSGADAAEPEPWPVAPWAEDRCPEVEEGVHVILQGGARTREEADQAYADMPPVTYEPPADRWEHLPKTAETLCNGGELRVHMLGDSIVNDTGRSRFELYLSEDTGARIPKLMIVRSSTGPVWYQEADRPYCYAARFAPDLLIMGGISMLDMDAWRTLIEKVRAESDAEILLMTQAFGRLIDPGNAETWSLEPEDDPDPYRVNLRALAEELGVGYLDMTREWGRYVNDSGEGIEAFKRDQHHANERGEQILGRVLKAHLDPRVGGNACE